MTAGPNSGIYTVPTIGGAVQRITNLGFNICEPGYGFGVSGIVGALDVSGGTVVFQGNNVFGHAAIYTIPLSGVIGIADPCSNPALKVTNHTVIARAGTPVPDDPQNRGFDIFGFASQPLIDGTTVVFYGSASNGLNPFDLVGLYSSHPGGLSKLVDTNTPVPGGIGNFSAPETAFAQGRYSLSGGNLVFVGADAADANGKHKQGLYWVPATGGPITRIIRVGDPLGDGHTVLGTDSNAGGFFQPPIQFDSLNGTKLAFRVNIETGPAIYVTDLAGIAAGDANGDGLINVLDLVATGNDILGISSAPGNANCNNDTTINVLDLVCIGNTILGI